MKKYTLIEIISLSILLILFLFIGSLNLGKFFTIDEMMWFTRVEQYWTAYLSGNFINTDTSSYPGTFHSFISGFVDLFLDKQDYLSYDKIHIYFFWWRFPILLFNTFSLLFIYLLLNKFFKKLDSFIIIFLIAFTPVIFGMSRIVNSDSLLWNTALITILSYIIYLRQQKIKYLIISGVFFGLSLSCKYNAIIIFVFQLVVFVLEYLYEKIEKEQLKKLFLHTILIWIISIVIFSIFLPAVFVNVNLLNSRIFHVLLNSPVFPLFFTFIIIDTFIFKNKILNFIKDKIKFANLYTKILPVIFISLLFISIAVVYTILLLNLEHNWTGNHDRLWQIPFFEATYLNLFSFLKSIQIHLLIGLGLFVFFTSFQKNDKKHFSISIYMMTFILLFILGASLQGVKLQARYIIMLFPYVVIIAVTAFSKLKKKKLVLFIFIFLSIASVVDIALLYPKFYPYYKNTNYFNNVRQYAWATGGYELAQLMNQKENAEDIKVLSDGNSFNFFFKGTTRSIIYREEITDSLIQNYDYLCLGNNRLWTFKKESAIIKYYKMPKDSFDYFLGDENGSWRAVIKIQK